MLIVVAVAVALRVSLPAYDACRETLWVVNPPATILHCGPCADPRPLTDLAELAVVGWPVDGTTLDTLGRWDVAGLAAQVFDVTVTVDDRPWSMWAVARDFSGNWSCQSNGAISGPWPLSVPLDFPGLGLLPKWYDIAGRRLARPPPSGIYFVRLRNETRKRVVVR